MSTQAPVTGGFSKWPGNHPGKYYYTVYASNRQLNFKQSGHSGYLPQGYNIDLT